MTDFHHENAEYWGENGGWSTITGIYLMLSVERKAAQMEILFSLFSL